MSRVLQFDHPVPSRLHPPLATSTDQEQLSLLVNDLQVLILRRPLVFQVIAHFAHRCRLRLPIEDNGTN